VRAVLLAVVMAMFASQGSSCASREGSPGLCRVLYEAPEGALWLSKEQFAEQFAESARRMGKCGGMEYVRAWVARGAGAVLIGCGTGASLWMQFEVVMYLYAGGEGAFSVPRVCAGTCRWNATLWEVEPRDGNWQDAIARQMCLWAASEASPRRWFGNGWEELGVDVQTFLEMELESPLLAADGSPWAGYTILWA
jgi:hypothetical protein